MGALVIKPLLPHIQAKADLYEAYQKKFGTGPEWTMPDPSTEAERLTKAIRTGVPIKEVYPPGFIPA